jgi:hypothetical protein
MSKDGELSIEVIGTELPGIRFAEYEPVHVGVQKGNNVVDAVPADRKNVEFKLSFRIGVRPDGSPNFLGPFAQGTPNRRFFYLSWGVVKPGSAFAMFRRAKIYLDHIEWKHIRKAIAANKPLRVGIKLTDRKGGPVCASVRDEYLEWEL